MTAQVLAATGANVSPWFPVVGAVLVLIGIGLFAWTRARGRRK